MKRCRKKKMMKKGMICRYEVAKAFLIRSEINFHVVAQKCGRGGTKPVSCR